MMSRKMMIAVMAGTISLLADHLASARGGGVHGGLHATPGAVVGTTAPAVVGATAPNGAVTRSGPGATGPSSGNGTHPVLPVTLSNGVDTVSSPTVPSSGGAKPAGIGGASPGSANGGLNNPDINPNDTGMAGTAASRPPAGTNTAGTALSSGLPTNGESDRQSADKAKRRTDEDGVFNQEAAKIGRVVNGICRGC
jgi:hypothetical protein